MLSERLPVPHESEKGFSVHNAISLGVCTVGRMLGTSKLCRYQEPFRFGRLDSFRNASIQQSICRMSFNEVIASYCMKSDGLVLHWA